MPVPTSAHAVMAATDVLAVLCDVAACVVVTRLVKGVERRGGLAAGRPEEEATRPQVNYCRGITRRRVLLLCTGSKRRERAGRSETGIPLVVSWFQRTD
jgi:hypothetical protein